jgi:dTDP-glucose 4,6-dehydratase
VTGSRLLVTGGAGFLGAHFVRGLLAGRHAGPADALVTVVDLLTYAGVTAGLDAVADDRRLTFVHGDVADARLLGQVVPGHDAVVHFAAETHVDRSIAAPAAFVRTNVVGTHALLDACLAARVATFVHVSTDEVYGPASGEPLPESAPLRPSSPYAASKAAADLLALAYHRTYGLDVRVTRGVNTYGPFQYPDKLVPLFVTHLLDGRRVPLYGDGTHTREWVHVDDHCRAIGLVLERGGAGESYNVGTGCELSNRDLTDRLLARCDAGRGMVDRVADRAGHDRAYRVDASKIRALGWTPTVELDDGLDETVQWYRANRTWWEPVKAAMPAIR